MKLLECSKSKQHAREDLIGQKHEIGGDQLGYWEIRGDCLEAVGH